MKKGLLTILLSVFFSMSYATPQVGDLLIYKGDTIDVYYFILEQYLQNSPSRDIFKEQNKELIMHSTGCWRGHQALMELREDSLFLLKVYGENRQEMDLTPLFSKKGNIFIDWYTGSLTNPRNLKIYVHDDWGGYYEYETDFIFEKGILKSIENYTNTIIPSVYMESDNLMNFVSSNINYDNVISVSNKVKVIVSIKDADINGEIIEAEVLRNLGGNDTHSREALRVIKSIPQWEVLYRRGEKESRFWNIPVVFEPKD